MLGFVKRTHEIFCINTVILVSSISFDGVNFHASVLRTAVLVLLAYFKVQFMIQ